MWAQMETSLWSPATEKGEVGEGNSEARLFVSSELLEGHRFLHLPLRRRPERKCPRKSHHTCSFSLFFL